MEAEYQLTAEEAEKEMEQLRKVFTIVRLVDANGIQCLASGKPSSKMNVPVIVSGEKTSLARIVFQRLPFVIRQKRQSLSF